MGVEAILETIDEDPIFDVEIAKFKTEDGSLRFSLELPKGLLNLKRGAKVVLDLGEESEGDLVMKGIVHRVDEGGKTVEISFHGLWLRLSYRKNPFELEEGQEIYLIMKFSG